jgi:hypothetical protein
MKKLKKSEMLRRGQVLELSELDGVNNISFTYQVRLCFRLNMSKLRGTFLQKLIAIAL